MLEIDAERFSETFDRYSAIGATDDGGLHRLALSDADRRVRDRFIGDLETLDVSVRIDELGNIFGRREGTYSDRAPVLVGSHLDSQPWGGRYDGQLGILSALEALRTLDDLNIDTAHPVEIVNWTNEEGSRFKPALLGSSTYVGDHALEDALAATDGDGTSLESELESIGYRGEVTCEAGELAAYLELHVEQGPKLDTAGKSIGIVDGIFGMAWLEVTIQGTADHAGPTPMDQRTDAMATAGSAINRIGSLPQKLSQDTVVTVGELSVSPNSINVIPDEVTFTIDVRSYDDKIVNDAIGRIETEVAAACDHEGTEYDFEILWQIPHTEFSPVTRTALSKAADQTGCSSQHIIGGAGHDAVSLQSITDAGLLFVPSVDGTTHNEDEYTEWQDAVAGANVLTNALLQLATPV